MQLRPREKTRETLRYQETSDYCYTTCTFLSALKLMKKKAPLHDEYYIVTFSRETEHF